MYVHLCICQILNMLKYTEYPAAHYYHMYEHTHAGITFYISIWANVIIYICVYVCVCIYIYMYIHIHILIHLYVYSYTY